VTVLKKIRKRGRIFSEAVLLVFTVVYFYTTVLKDDSRHSNRERVHATVSSGEIVLRNAPANNPVVQNIENDHSFDWEFTEYVVDLPGIKVILANAFFISGFERNVFYALTLINAP
jgi:hypothetical protein